MTSCGQTETAATGPVFPPEPDYTPYTAQPFRVAMGLLPLDLKDWIEPDAHLAADLAEKERLLAERYDEVVQLRPEAEHGSQEVLDLLAEHLRPASRACTSAAGTNCGMR